MRRHDKPPAAKDNDAKPRVNYVAPAGLARHALQALAPASTVDSVQSSPLSSAPSSSLHDSPAGKEVPQWGSTAAASTSATPVAATGDRGRSKSRDSQRDMMLDSPRKASVGLGKQAASSGPSSRKGAADTLHSPRRSTRSENIASPPVARVYAESSTVPPRSAGKTHWGDTSVATEDSLPSPKAQAASKEQLSTKKIQPSLVKVASTAKTTSPEGTEILIQLKSDEMPTAVNSPPFKEKQQTSKRELAFKKKQAAALARFATNKESTDKGLEQEPVANVQKEEQKHEPLPVKDQVMKQGSSQEIGKHKSASNEPSTTDIATADSAMPPPPLPLKRDTAAARNVNDHDLTLSIVPESTPTRRDIPVREGCRVESLTPGTPSEPLSRQRTITDGGASRSSSIVNMQVDDEKGDKMDVDDVDDDEEDVEFKEDSTAMDLLHSVCAILLAYGRVRVGGRSLLGVHSCTYFFTSTDRRSPRPRQACTTTAICVLCAHPPSPRIRSSSGMAALLLASSNVYS